MNNIRGISIYFDFDLLFNQAEGAIFGVTLFMLAVFSHTKPKLSICFHKLNVYDKKSAWSCEFFPTNGQSGQGQNLNDFASLCRAPSLN